VTDDLEVRWDYENDGTWDTNWSTTKITTHRYPTIGNHTVRLEVRDNGGLVANATETVPVTFSTDPPVIRHTPPPAVAEGDPIVITANVTDDVGVSLVLLGYREIGASDFEYTGMYPAGGDVYTFTIPAQDAPGTVAYWIIAADVEGNEVFHPWTGEHTVTVTRERTVPGNGDGAVNLLWLILLLVIVLVVAILLLLLWTRRRKPVEAPQAGIPNKPSRADAP
jgi:PKD repeat protein